MNSDKVMNMFKNGEITDQATYDRLTEGWKPVNHECFWENLKYRNDMLHLASFAARLMRYLDMEEKIDYASIADGYFKQHSMGLRDYTIKAICNMAGDWLSGNDDTEAERLKDRWAEVSSLWYWPHLFERYIDEFNNERWYAVRAIRARNS